MPLDSANRCESCRYWQDHTQRVMARLSVPVASKYANGAIELRRCRYSPPPTIEREAMIVYVDANFLCSAFEVKDASD